MIFHIRHSTAYTFSEPVFLEPHTVRMVPRNDLFYTMYDLNITVSPDPVGDSNILDLDGTAARFFWFTGLTGHLRIDVSCMVETHLKNPFAFILDPDTAASVPFEYPAHLAPHLNRELHCVCNVPEIEKFTRQLLKDSAQSTLSFLTNLTQHCYTHFEYEYRHVGNPVPPQTTMALKKGSCRDIALFFMEVCRHAGIAARFVSGYFFDPDNPSSAELHAWVEVFLPGAGWRGFDPSNGIMVAHTHIPLAASPDPYLTLPVHGSYRGKANSTMTVDLKVKKE